MEITKQNLFTILLFILLIVTCIVSFKLKKDGETKIETYLKEIKSLEVIIKSRDLEISSLESKLTELQSKSVSVKKVYYKTGQIKSEENLTEESSQKIQEVIKKNAQLSEEYRKEISSLDRQIKQFEQKKNNALSFGALAVYDSDRFLEAELFAKYDKYCSTYGKGISQPNAWRIGLGFCL